MNDVSSYIRLHWKQDKSCDKMNY